MRKYSGLISLLMLFVIGGYLAQARYRQSGVSPGSQQSPSVRGAAATPYGDSFFLEPAVQPGEISFRGGTMADLVVPTSDISEIRVVTTDKGPALDDCFFLFVTTSDKNALISMMTDNYQDILHVAQTLPNFDNAAVIRAMRSVDKGEFVVWNANAPK